MRVLHCCLAAFYIDDYGYQENVFPREHLRQGHEVEILASTETYDGELMLSYRKASRYVSNDGIAITRLQYVKWLPSFLARKLRLYIGITKALERFRPDVVFLHDLQFLSIFEVVQYCRRNSVRLYADTHTDYVNSGKTLLSRWVLHRIVYRFCAKYAARVAVRIWATLPIRAEFLVREYGISTERIGILPFGADDGRIDISLRDEIRYETRESLGIAHDEFVFVFGGKIDARKNAIQLLKAFSRMNSEHSSLRVRLVIFGEPVPSMAHEFSQAICQPKVTHVTWTAATELYRLFWASDFAVFPGTHSVLWEEAAGLGVPMAVRRWKGITHLDVGGNCIFLERADESELVSLMYHIASDRENFEQMRVAATTIGVANFAYSRIAARSISEESEHDG